MMGVLDRISYIAVIIFWHDIEPFIIHQPGADIQPKTSEIFIDSERR